MKMTKNPSSEEDNELKIQLLVFVCLFVRCKVEYDRVTDEMHKNGDK